MIERLDDKDSIIKRYKSLSPDEIGIEGPDGKYYPEDIPCPAISYVPPAEPHVIITDWYDNPQDWYSIESLIPQLIDQAFVAYYDGLYQASFLVSINCIELTLKYELIRNGHINPKDLEGKSTLGNIIGKKLEDINLSNFSMDLDLLNKARNGLLHFNPNRLREATIKILQDNPNDYVVPISNYSEWSRFAHFAYMLAYEITSKLYGESRVKEHLEKGLNDYEEKTKSVY